MTSNLAWVGSSTDAPGKYSQTAIQNKITSYQVEAIKDQYNKFLIYDTPNINRFSLGRATDQPFIIRGIQRRDGGPQFYGPGGRVAPENMMVRGGLLGFASRLAEDAIRMGKFLMSPKGLIWNVKQLGLQASNPNVETDSFVRATKIYNPLKWATNIVSAPAGIHSARHSTTPKSGRYGELQKQFIRQDAEGVLHNRLAKLKVEMFGSGAPVSEDQSGPTDLLGTIAQGFGQFIEPLQNALAGFDGSEISTLSGPGGPKSVYGIGYTSIRRAVTTGTGLKDNIGNAYWGIRYNPISRYESSDTPGSPRTLNQSDSPGNSIEKTYTDPGSTFGDGSGEGFLPGKDAETGGTAVLHVVNKFFDDTLYIQNESPKGGRYVGSDVTVEEHDRPKVDIQTGLVGSGETIIEGTPDTSNNAFAIGTKYKESFSPAENKSREEGVDDSPGGGRYVGSSHDGSEETHTRSKNAADKDLLEHSHKYHVYQNRDDNYPEGYYNLINANSGPRGKPSGGSKHNIYQSIEDESQLIRSLIDGKKLIEHVHSFLGEKTISSHTNNPSTGIIDHLSIAGYYGNNLHAFPVNGGADWDTEDRINLYQLIDPKGDAKNTNTPQIRKSAENVFEPGFPVNAKGEPKLFSQYDTTGTLNAVGIGEAIFNYFTPDLKYFTGHTREIIDDGGPHNYISLKQKYGLLESGDDLGNIFAYVYGLDDPSIVPKYNGIPFGSVYTPSKPKKGPSPQAGQQPISGQTSLSVKEIDDLILSKLDPMQNPDARPDETGGVKQIGGKPQAGAGTPLVYKYMDYAGIRAAAKQTGTVTGTKKIQEFRQAIGAKLRAEILTMNRDIKGYGGANQADALNALPVGGTPAMHDMVPFYLTKQGGGEACFFRAGINSISDNFSPEWQQEKEIGRADPKLLLSGFGRTISLDLQVAAGSETELIPMWDKLNTIAGWCAPSYVGNGYTGTFVELTLGDIYQQVPCYITTFSVDYDNETPWDITAGQRLPKYASVTIELGYIGKSIPQKGTKFFGTATYRGNDVAAGAAGASGQQAGDFDAPDDLITGLPDGVTQLADKPYNMAKDIGGDLLTGAASAVDWVIPGDQSPDAIAGTAKKAYGAGKKVVSFLNPFD